MPSSRTMDGLMLLNDLAVIMISALIGGWLAQKVGFSPIVGYLLAGIVVGTPEIAYPYISDTDRIQTLSQLGLVFLMFSIGLSLSLQRLRDFGFFLILATGVGAFLVLSLTRLVSELAGMPPTEGMFLGLMLIVSSSAIIGKVLQDNGLIHLPHGRLTLGITLLEDIVAVIALTFLGTYTGPGSQGEDPLIMFKTVGLLVGFVVLILLMGLIIMPRLLHWVNITGSSELETLMVGGLLFLLSIVAVKAGYSIALGAFLLGLIVAETPRLGSVQRTFSGLRDLFATVFFVSIGMGLQIQAVPEALPLILLGSALCIVGRTAAVWFGLLLTGENGITSFRAGLSVTPLGEFSFIIAGVGVSAGLIPQKFQVAAVGISLVTSLLAPLLIVRSEVLAKWVTPRQDNFFTRILKSHRRILSEIQNLADLSQLWQLSRKRIIQITVEMLLVTMIFLISKDLYEPLAQNKLFTTLPEGIFQVIYWGSVSLVCLASLVAIWRNICALIMIFNDSLTLLRPQWQSIFGTIQVLLRLAAAVLLLVWLILIFPIEKLNFWALPVLVVGLLLIILLKRRSLVRTHSLLEYEVQRKMISNQSASNLSKSSKEWGLNLETFSMPDYAEHAGKSIQEINLREKTGASIISLRRQGFRLSFPSPQSHLFPGDEILLMGTPEQIKVAKKYLGEVPQNFMTLDRVESLDTVLEPVNLPREWFPGGRKLETLNWPRLYGILIAGVRREGEQFVAPKGDFVLQGGDEILLLGPAPAIRNFKKEFGEISS